MVKIALTGLAVLFALCMAISGGNAWGAILWEVSGALWRLFCFNKFDS